MFGLAGLVGLAGFVALALARWASWVLGSICCTCFVVLYIFASVSQHLCVLLCYFDKINQRGGIGAASVCSVCCFGSLHMKVEKLEQQHSQKCERGCNLSNFGFKSVLKASQIEHR